MHRGSRKHILDWTAREDDFPNDLVALVHPVRIQFTETSSWMPRGHDAPDEARLETFGPKVLPERRREWDALRDWWLKHAHGANTPNWDLAVHCEVEGRAGLVLVEAKANQPELGRGGKSSTDDRSVRSRENHDHIRSAIAAARQALGKLFPGIGIDRDKHYQLSNRIAFAWKLASLDIPTVLVYLGFVGDTGMNHHFRDAAHWDDCFKGHLRAVCPDEILEGTIDLETAPMWVLSRTLRVIEPSRRRDHGGDTAAIAPSR
jgi:hypothetical protein